MNPLKEVFAFTAATVLSCGPSQVFGLVKGAVDCVRFSKIVRKQLCFSSNDDLARNNWSQFQKSKTFVVIQNKLNNENVSQEEALQYIAAKKAQTKEKMKRCGISLLADMAALITIVGAHISWRIATGYTKKSYIPFFTRSITHLVENHQKFLGSLLFAANDQKYRKSEDFKKDPNSMVIDLKELIAHRVQLNSMFNNSVHVNIPVYTSTRNRIISASYRPRESNEENPWLKVDTGGPTVVLFHGNAADEYSLFKQAKKYQKKGYNTLCVTIGGYGLSSGVTTTEATVSQDVEAVKRYLSQYGVTQVGYHGMSLGGAVSLHAAAAESSVELETLFVTVDKTFTSAKAVGGNVVKNFSRVPSFLEFAGRGVLDAAIRPGLSVELPGGKVIKTDGFDNIAKAKVLKEKGIPLTCVKGEYDFLMGFGKIENGKFQRNYADLLFETRYGASPTEEEKERLISQEQGHSFPLLNV
jgi:hypothetical protein